MHSWRDRAARRGGMTEQGFLRDMKANGFEVIPETLPASPQIAFLHPSTGDRRYEVGYREGFRRAFDRIQKEINRA